MMPIGQVALGSAGLLGVGRDRVEADIGEEDPRRPLGDAAPALVLVEERLPVRRVDVGRADADRSSRITPMLSSTIAALNPALSLMPMTRIDRDDHA